jgi:hypothetical protein
MLANSFIPQYEDEEHPEHWRRFIEKAAKGSCKAVEMFRAAHISYMVALTGDPCAPSEMPLVRYDALFSGRFPAAPPANTAQELLEVAVHNGYIPQPFTVTVKPRLAAAAYRKLWKRRTSVSSDVLMNDAVIQCFNRWSPGLCTNDFDSIDYDSLALVSGMLALCLIWPSMEQGAAPDRLAH